MIDRTADAHWEGTLKEGKGRIKLGSGAFEGPYAFGTRFENAAGTNPEELLGAAHAACFTMALGHQLSVAGHPPASLDTTATVHLDKVGKGSASPASTW
jgi:osmotically inducible protein OsmC